MSKTISHKPTSIPKLQIGPTQAPYIPEDVASRHNEIVERPVTQHSTPVPVSS